MLMTICASDLNNIAQRYAHISISEIQLIIYDSLFFFFIFIETDDI